MRKFFTSRKLLCGVILVGVMLAVTLVGLIWTPYDPYAMDAEPLTFFSAAHPLGTDDFGRDILSRVMAGARYSFLVGTPAVLIGLLIGGLLGLIAGYLGGKADELFMKIIDVQMAFPGILLALMLIAVLGTGIHNTVLALGLMSIPRFARIARSGAVRYRDAEFIRAARARGAGGCRILFLHILPHVLPDLIVTSSLSFAGAVMSEAGLSYLGLGLQPPTPSFGKMLSEAQGSMLQAGWYVLVPAVALTILVMGFHLIGDGLQEVLRHDG